MESQESHLINYTIFMNLENTEKLVVQSSLDQGAGGVMPATLKFNKHKPWIETSYHGVITENNDTVILDPPLVALDKDAPVPFAAAHMYLYILIVNLCRVVFALKFKCSYPNIVSTMPNSSSSFISVNEILKFD
ncbi:hypothetical protein ACRRTK_003250 [Alexandromys fortis]